MDDILKRLRKLWVHRVGTDDDLISIYREAADEIERLRKERDESGKWRRMREDRALVKQMEKELQVYRNLKSEMSVRIEYGAQSGGHLEALRDLVNRWEKEVG